MSLATIRDLATSKAARQILLTQKHSPKVLFAVGSVGVVTAAVMACRATLRLEEVLDEHERIAEKAHSLHEKVQGAAYSEQQMNADLTKNKVKLALDIGKLYAPAVGLGIVSVAALTGSHVILSRRNAGAMAAYAAVDKAYKEYRRRIVEEFGVDTDRKFATGAETVAVEEKTADGKVKTTTKDVVLDGGRFGGSPYAVVFDEHSKFFSREPGMNAMTVQMKQNWANDKLRANGHLFLNEVYDMLGIPRTKAGNCVGWVYRKDNEEKNGDNYVSFGVFDGEPELVEAFIDGVQSRMVLDFNVDGMILDLI